MTVSSWFSKFLGTELTLRHLEDVLILQLRDLTSAEEQLIEAFPRMIDAACDIELKAAFSNHYQETRLQRLRLNEVFKLLGRGTEIETCAAMKGLIAEAEEVAALSGDPEFKDAALIAAAQRIEHYEMAGYGCARTFARKLGYLEVVELLQETLDEERDADQKLTEITDAFVIPSTH